MNKQEFDALLMKLNQMYKTTDTYCDLQPYNVYNVVRQMINMIEDQKNKKKPTTKLTLLK